MTLRPHVFHLAIAVAGIATIIFVLAISIMRQTLYAPTAAEVQARSGITVRQRLWELREWPPAPDHPLYPVRMAHDQLRLRLATADARPLLRLEFATDRLHSAKRLLARQRQSLALTTLTKSTKYVLAASGDALRSSPHSSSLVREKMSEAISVQINELTALKQSFSDEQKSTIDSLILELLALQEQAF